MKRIIPITLFAFLISSCNGWIIQPIPYPTPIQLSSPTPSIYTATPMIGVTPASPTPVIETSTLLPTNTNVSPATGTNTPIDTITPTSGIPLPALQIIVLGCNTGVDVLHGMGEVTNAFVTLKNTGNVQLTNLVTTLYALDEGRVHPDKTKQTALLPVGFEVTMKLTVDSTYKQETPIQVETNSDQGLFPREGSESCRDIGVLTPNPGGLNTPVPSE